MVNTTTAFLDVDQAAADSNARDLATAPGTIFPSSTYGNVTTSGVNNGTAANPAGRLQARVLPMHNIKATCVVKPSCTRSSVFKPGARVFAGWSREGVMLQSACLK